MPPNPGQWGNPGYPGFQQAPPYSAPPNVGFQMPSQPQGFNVPLPTAHGAYDPNKPPYEDSNFVHGMGFDDKSIRQGFIRRVYSILSVSKIPVTANLRNFEKCCLQIKQLFREKEGKWKKI